MSNSVHVAHVADAHDLPSERPLAAGQHDAVAVAQHACSTSCPSTPSGMRTAVTMAERVVVGREELEAQRLTPRGRRAPSRRLRCDAASQPSALEHASSAASRPATMRHRAA